MVRSSGKGGGPGRVAKAARRSAIQSTCCQVVKPRVPLGRRMRWHSVSWCQGQYCGQEKEAAGSYRRERRPVPEGP